MLKLLLIDKMHKKQYNVARDYGEFVMAMVEKDYFNELIDKIEKNVNYYFRNNIEYKNTYITFIMM